MAMTRTKYIGIGTTVITILALLGFFNSDRFDLEFSNNIVCAEDCEGYFNITSNLYTYYLYNKGDVKLSFSPEIKRYTLCIKDGRYKYGKCGAGWRELDLVTPFYYKYKYVLKMPKGKKMQFKLIGVKEWNQTIKWGADAFNLDPVWRGYDINKICDYTDVIDEIEREENYEEVEQDIMDECGEYPDNYSCVVDTEEVEVWVGTTEKITYEKVCIKSYGYMINDDNLDCKSHCTDKDGVITCESKLDSNKDGILQSGESGFIIDVRDEDWNKLDKYIDSENYNDIRRCVINI